MFTHWEFSKKESNSNDKKKKDYFRLHLLWLFHLVLTFYTWISPSPLVSNSWNTSLKSSIWSSVNPWSLAGILLDLQTGVDRSDEDMNYNNHLVWVWVSGDVSSTIDRSWLGLYTGVSARSGPHWPGQDLDPSTCGHQLILWHAPPNTKYNLWADTIPIILHHHRHH